MKVRINHADVRPGPQGEWGYLLASGQELTGFDAVEFRGLDLHVVKAIKAKLPEIKASGKVLTLEANFRVNEVTEEFVTKAGVPATKKVARLYLESTAKWGVEVKPDYIGNLTDVLGGIDDIEAIDPDLPL